MFSPPRSAYIAFDVFPRAKGSSSHIASMVEALGRRHGPVWLLCLGQGAAPAAQREGELSIFRYKEDRPNVLARAEGFGGFVRSMLSRAGSGLELTAFRDPFGGAAALGAQLSAAALFEVNALPSWEMPYGYPGIRSAYAALAKLEDLERFCLLESDLILTVSEVTRSALCRIGAPADRIEVAPNSAAETFFAGGSADAGLEELSEGTWIGYVGSLHAWQGVDDLIDAFALVAEDLPDTRLVVVHNGRKGPVKTLYKRLVKRGVEDRVLLKGPVGPAELAAIMSRLALSLAPLTDTPRNTEQGCCPVKIVESMAAGTPALASDLRVCRELIEDGVDGALAPAGRPRAWALAIKRLLGDREALARMGRAARVRARRRHSREVIHARLERCFELAIERRERLAASR